MRARPLTAALLVWVALHTASGVGDHADHADHESRVGVGRAENAPVALELSQNGPVGSVTVSTAMAAPPTAVAGHDMMDFSLGVDDAHGGLVPCRWQYSIAELEQYTVKGARYEIEIEIEIERGSTDRAFVIALRLSLLRAIAIPMPQLQCCPWPGPTAVPGFDTHPHHPRTYPPTHPPTHPCP